MKKCSECGKELRFWEGYYHPVLGRKEIVCSKCFEKIESSVEDYRRFLLDSSEREKKKVAVKNIKNKSRFSSIWNNLKTTH